MNLKKVFAASAASVFVISSVFASGGAHWTYKGHEGPSNWGNLNHGYAMCKDGKKQSPIDINATKKIKLSKINFSYRAEAKEIINNGHTVQVNMKKGSSVTVAGKTFNLLQFHFHSPSEHTINGKPADMVAHFVHQAKDGQLGVVGVLFKAGKENKTLAKLWKYMPKKAGDKKALAAGITIAKLLPGKTNYYHYSGSLTTPPCSENVNWMVLQATVSVSAAQVEAFSKVIHKNVRPVQPHNGRTIESS